MRLEITITQYMLGSGKVVQALRDVFGHRAAKYANFAGNLTIECRADQFVRFLLARDANGASNDWKSLKVTELTPVVIPPQVREVFG
jgi:hypothetical protein